MSTRGVIAKVGEHEGEFSGVYHHWDSYCTGLGKALWAHLHGHFKGDIARMLHVLTVEHCGWSTICDKDFRLKPAYSNDFKKTNPACYCHGVRSEKVAPITHAQMSDTDCDWAYIFDTDKRRMYVRDLNHGAEMIVELDGAEPDWEALECGGEAENWARCGHYAWRHKLLPRTSNLSTQAWLGNKPLDFHDVVAVVVGGKRYAMTGSGGNSEFLSRTSGQRFPRNTWVSSVKARNGKRLDLPVAKIVEEGYAPLPGVTFVYPPTKVNPHETFVTTVVGR